MESIAEVGGNGLPVVAVPRHDAGTKPSSVTPTTGRCTITLLIAAKKKEPRVDDDDVMTWGAAAEDDDDESINETMAAQTKKSDGKSPGCSRSVAIELLPAAAHGRASTTDTSANAKGRNCESAPEGSRRRNKSLLRLFPLGATPEMSDTTVTFTLGATGIVVAPYVKAGLLQSSVEDSRMAAS